MACRIPTQFSFGIMFVVTTLYFAVELTIGYLYHSLVLQADAYHMLSDVVSLVIGYMANRISSRTAMNDKGEIRNTFGWVRSEVVGALINSIFLVALCFTITIEAFIRFSDPQPTQNPLIVMYVAIGGLVLNGIGLVLFHGHAHGHSHQKSNDNAKDQVSDEELRSGNEQTIEHDHIHPTLPNGGEFAEPPTQHLSEQHDVRITIKNKPEKSSQMNIKGVYLHILGDFLGSIIVIISCLVLKLVDKPWVNYLDPSLSLISVAVLLVTAIPLANGAMKILIQTVPEGFDVTAIKNELMHKFDEISDIHEFHLWQLVGSKYIATLHIKFKGFHNYMVTCEQIKNHFHSIGIHSLTIQPEFYSTSDDDPNDTNVNSCLLACPPGNECRLKQCC